MSATVHYTLCPVCNGGDINPLFTAKDHTVSGKEFVIWQCSRCTLRFTQDAPDEGAMGSYYKSEEYISHSNTDKGFINKLYQQVRKLTLKQKAALVIKSTGISTGRLLEVGAGTGGFAHTMKEKGWVVEALEPDEKARNKAKQLFQLSVKDASEVINLPHASFHAITLWHVLEHIYPLHDYIGILKKLLAKDGKIFIAVPNYMAMDADIYRLHWAAYDVPRHLYHFTPKAMDCLLRVHGLRISDMKRMWFDSFYISMLSSKYRRGSTNLFASFVNGLRSNMIALINKERCSSLIYVVEKA
jgi:2-polyprenyl-3-methyl-5-hydroxy-6-metoxy-1,4-benzoquinol methylase